jgi:hypothetical protein
MSLTRVAVGPILLKGLALGEFRPLSKDEVDLLRKVAAGIDVGPARSKSKGKDRPSGRDRDRKPPTRGSGPVGTKAPAPASGGSKPGRLPSNLVLSSGAVVGAGPRAGSRPAPQGGRPTQPQRPAPQGGRPAQAQRPGATGQDRRPPAPGGRKPGPAQGQPPRQNQGGQGRRPMGQAGARPSGGAAEERTHSRRIIGLDSSLMPDRGKGRKGGQATGSGNTGSGSGSGNARPEKPKQKRPPRAAHNVKRKPRNKDRG